jgi:hypothetical protein
MMSSLTDVEMSFVFCECTSFLELSFVFCGIIINQLLSQVITQHCEFRQIKRFCIQCSHRHILL